MTVDIFSQERPVAARPRPRVRLLDAVVDLERGVPVHERPVARGAVVARAHTFKTGPLPMPTTDAGTHPFAWVVLDGIVLRRTYMCSRPGAELLGAGDLIDVHPHDADLGPVATRTAYVVHRRATVAVLDDRFRTAARRWPGLHEVLREQQAAQSRRASRQLAAALGLSRVEDRLVALFTDIAHRWGRMTPEGVVIDLALTHSVLGELVGSRRPTVSLALAGLSAAGTIVRRSDQTWLLAPELIAAA